MNDEAFVLHDVFVVEDFHSVLGIWTVFYFVVGLVVFKCQRTL